MQPFPYMDNLIIYIQDYGNFFRGCTIWFVLLTICRATHDEVFPGYQLVAQSWSSERVNALAITVSWRGIQNKVILFFRKKFEKNHKCAEERQKDLQLLEAAAEGGAGKAGKMLVPKAQDADDEDDSDEDEDDESDE